MTQGSCHCGTVTWQTANDPPYLVECTCSICHRYGAIWGHGTEASVRIEGNADTVVYSHGDRVIAFHHCAICGCVTHYSSLPGGDPTDRVSVNMRMAPPKELKRFRIRTFDGAETWAFLD